MYSHYAKLLCGVEAFKQIGTFLTFTVITNSAKQTEVKTMSCDRNTVKNQQRESKEQKHHHFRLDLLCHAMFRNLCPDDHKVTSGVECGNYEHIYTIRVTV